MQIIDRYLRKQLLITTLLTLLALLALDSFLNFVNELRLCKGSFSVWHAFICTVLTLPRRMYWLLPWSAMLGTLLCLGWCALNHELIVLETSCISRQRIALSCLKGMLLLTIIMILVGEVIAPLGEQIAHNIHVKKQNTSLESLHGVWMKNGNEFIHIGHIEDRKTLKNITRIVLDNNLQVQEITFARHAKNQDQHWLLEDIQGTKLGPTHTQKITHSQLKLQNFVDLKMLHTITNKHLDYLSIKQLWQIIKSRQANDLSTTRYQMALWNKLLQPLVILIMTYLAIPWCFTIARFSVSNKLLIGLALSFTYYVVNSICRELPSIITCPPFLSAIIPALSFTLLGVLLMHKPLRN